MKTRTVELLEFEIKSLVDLVDERLKYLRLTKDMDDPAGMDYIVASINFWNDVAKKLGAANER